MKALPFDMFELLVNHFGYRVLPNLEQAFEYRAAPDNPKHVESTKSID
jgi:hypothetical protein